MVYETIFTFSFDAYNVITHFKGGFCTLCFLELFKEKSDLLAW